MTKYRIERTELHTRVWEIEAESEDDALDTYLEDGDEDEERSYHAGTPDVRITTREAPVGKARQTACRHCGQDIENMSPYRKGEWRDRGNNTHCPTPAGDAGLKHAPTRVVVFAA